jgi:hypothetical protein
VTREEAVSFIPSKVPGLRSYEGETIRDYASAFVGINTEMILKHFQSKYEL